MTAFQNYLNQDEHGTAFVNGRYRVVVCDQHELPHALRDDWNRLAGERPLARWEWQAAWWRTYREPSLRLAVLVVCDEARRVVAIAPWYRSAAQPQGRTLRFCGDNRVCTDYQSLLVEPGYEEAATAALGEWLLGPGRTEWHVLDFRGTAAGDPTLARLTELLERRGARLHRRDLARAWRIELPPTWDAFLRENLSRKRREKVRELEKKYVRKGRVVLRTLRDADRFDDDYAVLTRLHASRRNSIGDAGCFACPRFAEFQRNAMRGLLDSGHLRLQTMDLDGTPAASIYAVRAGDGWWQYQSGMDAARSADQPGWTAIGLALRQAIEEGAKFWDFLRGDEPYKASWSAQPVALDHLRVAAPGTRGYVRMQAWTWRDRLRDWWKGTPEAASIRPARTPAPVIVESDRETDDTSPRIARPEFAVCAAEPDYSEGSATP